MLENKKTRRRQNSNKAYIDALQESYSKINVIRVDIAYKKDQRNRDFETGHF